MYWVFPFIFCQEIQHNRQWALFFFRLQFQKKSLRTRHGIYIKYIPCFVTVNVVTYWKTVYIEKQILLYLPQPNNVVYYPFLALDPQSNTGWHKKRELLKNPTKIEEIQEKKFIDRNWTITTCLLRDSNPNYQCLKITSCGWLCRMRLRRILQSMQHTQGDIKERELLKCVVAVKECIRGGGRHPQDVIFKHW